MIIIPFIRPFQLQMSMGNDDNISKWMKQVGARLRPALVNN